MDAPTQDHVRRALAHLDPTQKKIVAGMLTLMIQHPARVREREWVAEQLTQVSLLACELEAESPAAGVEAVHAYLQTSAEELLRASFLLFQRVALDLAPRAAAGFGFEEALRLGLEYLPPSRSE